MQNEKMGDNWNISKVENENLTVHFNRAASNKVIFRQVCDIAVELREFMGLPNTRSAIASCHQLGGRSTEIQQILTPALQKVGFQSECLGLFSDGAKRVRPDFFLDIPPNSGILCEVERGKTTTNNMDLLDFWKCHICNRTRYLFLIVPHSRPSENGRALKEFSRVKRRLGCFFRDENLVNVDGAFIFGY